MAFSLFRVKYVPVYTAFDVNRAWIVQEKLLCNGIKASIEVESCTQADLCASKASFSVCVPGNKANKAKELLDK